MVITTIDGLYLHAAWATDPDGTDFSLTEFEEALYVGHYTDKFQVESLTPSAYTWKEIDIEEVDEEDIDEDTEDYIDLGDLSSTVDELGDTADELAAHVTENAEDLQDTQNTSDIGLGNVNELHNTNKGAKNWTVSAGLSLSEYTGTIYNDTKDPVNYVRITCNTPGQRYAAFEAAKLRDKLAELTEDNAYTFSADVRMSDPVEIPVSIKDTDGTNEQLIFANINNSVNSDMDGWSAENVWVYTHSTANSAGTVDVSDQVLYFDLSNMAAGDTLDIANLKIEAGALATPWKDAQEAYMWIAYADDDQGTNISIDPDGKMYMGIAVNQTTETVDISDPAIFTWSKVIGVDGEDAVTLRIDSSRGVAFKNSQVSTVLSAVIYRGSLRITDIAALQEEFGSGAYLEWKWQGYDSDTWHTISSSDSRLGNDGFTLTLSPEDVDIKAVFNCNLII